MRDCEVGGKKTVGWGKQKRYVDGKGSSVLIGLAPSDAQHRGSYGEETTKCSRSKGCQ